MSDPVIRRFRRHRTDPNTLYGVPAIAKHIEKAVSTTYKIVEAEPRKIPAYKVGGEWRMKIDEYEASVRRVPDKAA